MIPILVCCHCGKPEHWAHICPEGLDIHYLLAEEHNALIMELLTVKDTLGAPSQRVNKEVEEEGEGVQEDF